MTAEPLLNAQSPGAVPRHVRGPAQRYREGSAEVRRALRAAARRTRGAAEGVWRRGVSAPRSYSYAALGLLLALGAPAGLLLVRALSKSDDIVMTYLYVTYSTMAAFALVGYLLGRGADEGRRDSITDPLTGLFTSRYFAQRLADEGKRARRHGHTLSVLYVDIERASTTNDGAVLAVRRVLRDNARAGDVVARLGGDEFAVLLPETSVAQAAALSQRIRAEVAWQGDLVAGGLAISISMRGAARAVDGRQRGSRSDQDSIRRTTSKSRASCAVMSRIVWASPWGGSPIALET